MARKDYPHGKKIYVPTADFNLWEKFAQSHPNKTSAVIMKLLRLYLSGRLYTEDGKQITGL